MTEQEFLTQFNNCKILTYPLTLEIWHKNIFTRPSLLSLIIEKSIENQLDVFSAINDTIKDKKVTPEVVTILCSYIPEGSTDQDINKIATMTTIFCGDKTKHFQAQLKIANKIKEQSLKKECIKTVLTNLAHYNHYLSTTGIKTQEYIYQYWTKKKYDPQEIKELIPYAILDISSIHHSHKTYETVNINCLKLANEYNVKSVHVFDVINSIINKYKETLPKDISFESSNKDDSQILLLFEKNAFIFDNTLQHFLHQINDKQIWWKVTERNNILKEIPDIINTLILAKELDEKLTKDSKANKKKKI